MRIKDGFDKKSEETFCHDAAHIKLELYPYFREMLDI